MRLANIFNVTIDNGILSDGTDFGARVTSRRRVNVRGERRITSASNPTSILRYRGAGRSCPKGLTVISEEICASNASSLLKTGIPISFA